MTRDDVTDEELRHLEQLRLLSPTELRGIRSVVRTLSNSPSPTTTLPGNVVLLTQKPRPSQASC